YRAERISYEMTIPADAKQYFVVFQYAVVFEQYWGHRDYDHPRFTAKLIDPITKNVDPCANFDFNSFNTFFTRLRSGEPGA
ncbi:MAG: hypothetical protein ACK48G_06240, partial [Chitinophagaceae bacterium]